MNVIAQALGSIASLSDQASLTGSSTYLLTATGDRTEQRDQSCRQRTRP